MNRIKLLKMICVFAVCCTSTLFVQAQDIEFDWVKSMGGAGDDRGTRVAVDKDGNVYTTGYFNGKVDFDPGPGVFNLIGDSSEIIIPNFPIVLTQYTATIFVSKLDVAGNFVWAKSFGGPVGGDRLGKGIAVDDSGYVYITGGCTGTTTFDTITLNSTSFDVYVAKLDTSGNVIWAKGIGGPSENDYGTFISVDTSGNVYTTGFFGGTSGFGADTLTSNGDWDIFVSKMDASGNILWAKGAGGGGLDFGLGLTNDILGNVYVTGYFNQTVDFDPGSSIANLVTNGFGDGFIWKLDTSGNFIWVRQIGGVGFDIEQSIALDAFGNLYTTGQFMGTVDFDPDAIGTYNLTANGLQDAFISKMDTAGHFIWARAMGGAGTDNGLSVAVDAVGNVYANGMFTGTVDFDPGAGTFSISSMDTTKNDMFFSKLDSAGNFVWAKNIGLSTDVFAETGIAVDKSGNLHATYSFGSYAEPGLAVDFDPGPDTFQLSATGSSFDVFVLKLACHPDSSSVAVNNCEPYTINGETFSQTGVYTTTFTSHQGCDSVVTLNLTIEVPEAIITIEIDTLSTTQGYATYQWFKNGNLIIGATNRKYTITENADYQVVVTNEQGCTDTSDIYTVNNHGVGIDDVNGIAHQIGIYPNPATHLIHVNSPVAINVVLTSLDGRALLHMDNAHVIPVKELAEGVYFLRIMDKEGRLVKVEKIVKQ